MSARLAAWLRGWLLLAVLRLRWPPFRWGYAFVYWLAGFCVVRSLRRVPGLAAIYLSGSLAEGRPRYGLSDIDFKIFLDGSRDARITQAIRRRFLRLRRLFPMLGAPDEKGIYFLGDLAAERQAYPLVRLLFDPRFYRHRLLAGRDVLAAGLCTPLPAADVALALPWRLKEWNEKLLLLLDAPSFAEPQRRYLLWKALADVGRFCGLLDDAAAAEVLPRVDAVARLRTRLPAPLRPLLDEVVAEHAGGFLRDRLDGEQRFSLGREVLCWAVARFAQPERDPREVRAKAFAWPETADAHAEALRKLCPSDAHQRLLDFFFVAQSPLDVDGHGSFVRLVELSRAITAAEYRALRQAFRSGQLGPEPIFVVEQGRLGHCLWSPMLDHYLVAADSEDGLLAFAAAAQATSGTATMATAGLRRRLAAVIEQLPALLDSSELPRLGRERLLRFFFANLRALFLGGELRRPGPLVLPGTPTALVDLLAERGLPAADAAFLHDVLAGAPASWRGLRAVLAQGLEVAAGKRDWHEVTVAAPHPLTLSVVVITRNRARQLERCLRSVQAQVRPPDEIVVVDNGSRDDTGVVLGSFAAKCPLSVVWEERPGVGHARVAGCSAATGDVLAFIDDDAVADPHWLAALEQVFALDERVGLVGGRIEALADGRSDFISRAFARTQGADPC